MLRLQMCESSLRDADIVFSQPAGRLNSVANESVTLGSTTGCSMTYRDGYLIGDPE